MAAIADFGEGRRRARQRRLEDAVKIPGVGDLARRARDVRREGRARGVGVGFRRGVKGAGDGAEGGEFIAADVVRGALRARRAGEVGLDCRAWVCRVDGRGAEAEPVVMRGGVREERVRRDVAVPRGEDGERLRDDVRLEGAARDVCVGRVGGGNVSVDDVVDGRAAGLAKAGAGRAVQEGLVFRDGAVFDAPLDEGHTASVPARHVAGDEAVAEDGVRVVEVDAAGGRDVGDVARDDAGIHCAAVHVDGGARIHVAAVHAVVVGDEGVAHRAARDIDAAAVAARAVVGDHATRHQAAGLVDAAALASRVVVVVGAVAIDNGVLERAVGDVHAAAGVIARHAAAAVMDHAVLDEAIVEPEAGSSGRCVVTPAVLKGEAVHDGLGVAHLQHPAPSRGGAGRE